MESSDIPVDLKGLPHMTSRLIVFDLDGTLIEGDLGEAVFYLLLIAQTAGYPPEEFDRLMVMVQEHQEIASEKNEGVAGYLRSYLGSLKQGKYVDAYQITAEYYLNYTKEKVLQFTQKVLEMSLEPMRTRITLGEETFTIQFHARREPMMSSLLHALLDQEADLMILSASPQWAVEAFCLYEGIPVECARGARMEKNGKIDVPYGQRKLEIIRSHDTKPPLMVFGNSLGDMEMLAAAELPFVRKTSQDQLLEKAKQLHWRIV
jgi:phosphoserine phosphatase